MSDDEIALKPGEKPHSKLGPSKAHRYRPCPGSVKLCENLPDTAGIEAAHGNVFHEFADICLDLGLRPEHLVGATMTVGDFGELEFTDEMARKMQPALDWIAEHYDADDDLCFMFVENRLDLSGLLGEGELGTADLVIIDVRKNRMIVFDWKWGQGVPVTPDWNDQGIIYWWGAWDNIARRYFFEAMAEEHGWDEMEIADAQGAPWEDEIEVWIVIEQPRHSEGGGIWKTTVGALLVEAEKIKADAERTRDPHAPRVPGAKQCQFCPAAKFQVCPEQRDFVLSRFDTSLAELEEGYEAGREIDLPPPSAWTPEARSQLLLNWPMIERVQKELHAQAYADAENGRPTPGMMMVDGRHPPRKWKDEDAARTALLTRLKPDKIESKKLISPAQAEELLGAKAYLETVGEIVNKGEPKPQLVPDTSSRERRATRAERLDSLLDGDDDDDLKTLL